VRSVGGEAGVGETHCNDMAMDVLGMVGGVKMLSGRWCRRERDELGKVTTIT